MDFPSFPKAQRMRKSGTIEGFVYSQRANYDIELQTVDLPTREVLVGIFAE